ncbi:MAG: proton-translocating transhydrogenase family protein [Bacilli bacterium]|jgi:NAD(P) transhydrogenase subunit alpha|nr:proton-translocating transhydrogenase family protein [Bacilli bacterium]MDD4482592.1 proton-translocating transhydrogenase family protein [Bacilli bacterium]
MDPLILIGVFVVSTVLGYILIKNVPSLLYTPLMSGMNALSGITVLGAFIITKDILEVSAFSAAIIGGIAIIFAMVNVVGGFSVTDKMLNYFVHKENK